MRTSLIAVAVVTAGVALAAQSQSTQSQSAPSQPTFRGRIDLVEVDVRVADAQGRDVKDLTADDFEIVEDGKVRPIRSFAIVDLPAPDLSRTGAAVQSDVAENPAIEGRVYLLVLDGLHTDLIRSRTVKAAARRFIETSIGRQDRAAVVIYGAEHQSQEFTSDTSLLLAAVDRFMGGQITPGAGAISAKDLVTEETKTFDLDVIATGARAGFAANSLERLAEMMIRVPARRKAMILFSEGFKLDPTGITNVSSAKAAFNSSFENIAADQRSSLREGLRRTITAAARANVNIYAVDPHGLAADLFTADGVDVRDKIGPGPDALAQLRADQMVLSTLASETGGFAGLNTNSIADVLARIAADGSRFYLLGFEPGDRRPGTYNPIKVRVKRAGLTARARKGYAIPPNVEARDVLADALNAPVGTSGLPIALFVAPFKKNPDEASVGLVAEVDASALTFVVKDGVFTEQLRVATTFTDAGGDTHPGSGFTIDLALRPEAYARARSRGIRLLLEQPLAPGRYQVRLAVSSRDGAIGSVVHDVRVPDFYKAAVSMSGLAISSEVSRMAWTVKPQNPSAPAQLNAPTAVRTFTAGDALTVVTDFYTPARNASAVLDIRADLRDEAGQIVQQFHEEARDEVGVSATHPFAARIPLAGLTAGRYVLHVQGQVLAGDRPSVSRDVPITIRTDETR